MSPFFSVVIPVYNRADVLPETLRSVLGQSERDFEIIVVDDGSTDDPKRAIAALADSRIVYVRQENRGGSAARNTGIDLARGQFVAFLDSDDIFLRDHLATMRLLLEGTEHLAAYAPIIVDRGNGRSFAKPPRALAPGEHMANYLMCDRGFVPTITLAVPRDLARRVRYDEKLPFAQDTDFAIRLYLEGCAFAMAEKPGAVWDDRPDPKRTSSGRKGARLIDWIETLRSRIPPKAYHGARGWMIAKGVASSDRLAALRLYLAALLRGCYHPELAATIFLQIFFSDRSYRRFADAVIAWRRGAVWSHSTRAAKPRTAEF
jgi:glycosyltransferase involved in cell wall biosynthesis